MKLLIIGAGNPTPTFIERRLNKLAEAGIELFVVLEYGQASSSNRYHVVRQGGWTKMKLHDMFVYAWILLSHISKFWKLVSIKKEFSILTKIKWALKAFPICVVPTPDIIHLQWISMGNDFAWLKEFYACPIVASARGSQVTIYPLVRSSYSIMIRKALQTVDFIHCVSNDIRVACLRLGANESKIIVNYNGIDTNLFNPTPIVKADVFQLISIGSLIWRKGYLYQLLLLKALHEEGNRVNLIIVGEGPDKEGLEYTATLLGLGDFIVFKGKQSSDAIVQLLNQSHLYISTSAAEGLPNSVLEAVSCSLPIVAFQCEGISDLIQENVNGFIISFGNINEMVKKVSLLINKNDVRKEMGMRSRELAIKRFEEQYWVNEMITFYNSIGEKGTA